MEKLREAATPAVLFVIWFLFAGAMGALVLLPPRAPAGSRASREPAVLSAMVESIDVVAPRRPRARAAATATATESWR